MKKKNNMKKIVVRIILLLLLFSLSNCDNFNTPKGDLYITVYNQNGEIITGVDVYVFEKEIDIMKEENNFYSWQVTNYLGEANFRNIDAQEYLVLCKIIDEQNNISKLIDSVSIAKDSISNLSFYSK